MLQEQCDGHIIRASGLVKRFGEFIAVDGIDLDIRRGEIFGFIGPNGAGKTTTIRILTMLSTPTEGDIIIDGSDFKKFDNSVKENIGIVQQHISLERDVTVRENIMYHAILHRMPRKDAEKRLMELSSIFGLQPYLDKLVLNLSGGWKRRVAIVSAMMHNPKILFLDEPTAGLDTQSRHTLWKIIRDFNSTGTTIFLTTHYMDEAEALCDRVAIIDKGHIISIGTPSELVDGLGQWVVEYDDPNGRIVKRFFKDLESSLEFQKTLVNARPSSRSTSLEDVFLEITGENDVVLQEVKYRV